MVLLFSGTLRQLGYLESFAAHFFECPSACCPGGMLHRLVFSWQSCSILGFVGSPAAFWGFGLCLCLAFLESLPVLFFGIPFPFWYFLECYDTRDFWSASSRCSGGVLHHLLVWECFSVWWCFGSALRRCFLRAVHRLNGWSFHAGACLECFLLLFSWKPFLVFLFLE